MHVADYLYKLEHLECRTSAPSWRNHELNCIWHMHTSPVQVQFARVRHPEVRIVNGNDLSEIISSCYSRAHSTNNDFKPHLFVFNNVKIVSMIWMRSCV